MRIGTTLGGYDRFGSQKYQKVKEHGFSAVDFSLSDTNTGDYRLPLREALLLLRQEYQLARDAGIDIWQVHGPWRWPPQDATEAHRQERLEKMQRSMEMCVELGCKNWVIHPIMPHGEQDRDTKNAQETWELNYIFFRKLLETAKAYDVTICLENMPFTEFPISTVEHCISMVDKLGRDNLRICLDTGHAAIFEKADVARAVKTVG